jgi:phosphatidylserine/phosphatidylglycerophosphate/cardiolipin synthase-like enzyme
VALLGPLVVATLSCAHTAARTEALQQLAATWPVVPGEAWISGHRLSVMLADGAGEQRFRARWEHRGLDEHGYRFRTAPLLPADLKPEEDEKPERARPVTVLDAGAWERFAHAFGERLAPERRGEATLLQIGGTDLLLSHGEGDDLVVVPGRGASPEIAVVARHNLVEIAQGAARFIEAEAARTGVGGDVFLFVMPPRGHGEGLVLFDTAQKLCVAVTLPRPQPRRGGTPLSRNARSVVALTIEAHGIALIKNPVSSVGRLVNIFGQWLATLVTRSRPSTDQPIAPLAAAAPMDLPSWERELDRLTGGHASLGAIRLLINGERYFPVLEQRIREAAESVSLRVNIFDTDDVALRIADLLRERSREVRVRVVMDELSTMTAGNFAPATAMPRDLEMPASVWRYLERDSGVSARAFLNPWMSSDHTKVFLFDRRYAHLGGMNIGREYRYEWHDMMVELEGPVVGRFARDFERSWAHASALGDLAFAAAATTSTSRFAGEAERADYVAVRPLYTRTGNPQIYSAVMSAAGRAQSAIWVENPYLYENSFVNALVKARRRGVDVRVVLPSDSDLGLGNASNMVTANALIANGVRVYVYPGMTHIKAAIFDGWACIGSANFNKLSLRRNLEANIATSDSRFVEELRRELFERDFADSHELTEPVAITGGDSFAEWVMSGF